MAIVLTAVFVAVGVSMMVDPGHFADSSKEEGSDTPASSQLIWEKSFTVSPNPAYVGEEVTFWANATSWDSTSITFTIYYDSTKDEIPNPEGAKTVNVTTGSSTPFSGYVVQKFTFNALGNFTNPGTGLSCYYVQLTIDDGMTTPNSNVTVVRTVEVRENSSPEFVTLQEDVYADAGETVNLTYRVIDPDNDPIDIVWEFGDGTSATNSTDGSYKDRYVNQTHVWNPYVEPGTGGYRILYKLNFTATDVFGNNATATADIYIDVPENKAPKIALTASPTRAEPGQTVMLIANATDAEGEPLTWTFSYPDNTTEVVHTGETEPGTLVWCNMTHVFDEIGNYTVRLNVSDAIGANQVWPHNVSRIASVVVAANRLPFVEAFGYTPGALVINATIGYLDVRLSVDAMDPDGDILTVSWYLDNATDPLINVSAGGKTFCKFVQVLTITEPRSYNVSIVVTDGREGHEVTVSRMLNASSDNMPPSLIRFEFLHETVGAALPNQEIEFFLTLSDREHDVIEVIINFGDDTPAIHVNLTEYDGRNTSYVFTHAYQHRGTYKVTLWYSDNKIGVYQESHSRTVTVEVRVEEPHIDQVVPWDWWDYTSLGSVFAIPLLVAVRMYMLKRRRASLEREGLTLEEAQMKSDEMLLQRLIEGGEGGR